MSEAKNIKELPQSDAMASGDYFLIETPAGTQLLNFDNFVIDQDNTTFAAELQTNVTTLSTAMTSVSASTDLSNDESSISIVNNSLTEMVNNVTLGLYGEEFESTITEFIINGQNTPGPESESRAGMSNLQALSAMIYDELYSRVQSLSTQLVGETVKITDEELPYTLLYDSLDSKNTPSLNSGGLLGIVLNTALKSVDVFVNDVAAIFKQSTGDTVQLSINNVPARYNISIGSLQFNIQYENEANLGSTDPDPNPYTNPGTFVITNYSVSSEIGNTGTGVFTHTWTIKRIGGTEFTDDSYPIKLNGRVVAGVKPDA